MFACLFVFKQVVQSCFLWGFLRKGLVCLTVMRALVHIMFDMLQVGAMSFYEFMHSRKRINYHDDIVLRTPTISIGERMLIFGFKNTMNTINSILEFEYPECEKEFQDILKDLRWNGERILLALRNVRSLNGLFGLQCYSSFSNYLMIAIEMPQ